MVVFDVWVILGKLNETLKPNLNILLQINL